MQTRPLDPFDDEQLRAFYDVSWRAEMEDGRPWNGHWTYEELTAELREPNRDRLMLGHCAYDGDTLVGAGVVNLGLLDNTDKGWVFAMVDPPHRRRGAGTALVEDMVDRVRADGRTEVLSSASYAGPESDDAPAVRFATRLGFRIANTEITRNLPLPVDPARLDAVEAEGAERREGYTVQTHVGAVPDDLLPSYCGLVNQLILDAPHGDLTFEESRLTPEIARENMAKNRALGRTVYYSLAVRDGEAVAQSDLAVQPGDSGMALQWATLVHRDHRGHRLGAAVKVANLRTIQRDRPDVTVVQTENAETNAFMVSINERLGFEVVAVSPSFARRLEA
jgi:GNAT superfamily N-acetyltransferase